MEFINNTSSPALNFEGIDTQQEFHVVVTRQTYTWGKNGLLILADEQDPLCMIDELVDRDDVLSGLLQESDLCHYKPNCDIIIKGHAYAPGGHNVKSFKASLHVKTPDKYIFTNAIKANKTEMVHSQPLKRPKIDEHIKGEVLIDKTLLITGYKHIKRIDTSVINNYRLYASSLNKVSKVSLNPSSSLGGYCLVDNDNPNLELIDTKKLIPKEERRVIPTKSHTAPIAYFSQDTFNPNGTGYLTRDYIKSVTPSHIIEKKVRLPQIHNPRYPINDVTLTQLLNGNLDEVIHEDMVVGFGVCSKTNPNRNKYVGRIDDQYIERVKNAKSAQDTIPDGFDFAIWNCAYPDQQVEKIVGNEWITLTNLCESHTPAAKTSLSGDTKLTLYLPEILTMLLTKSRYENYPDAEIPMKIDTIVINPDARTVNIVWRGIIASSYNPQIILLECVSREQQQQLLKEHFTQKGDIVRPHLGA